MPNIHKGCNMKTCPDPNSIYGCLCKSCENYKCRGGCDDLGLNDLSSCYHYYDWITKMTGEKFPMVAKENLL